MSTSKRFAILAEDNSDAESLTCILKRHFKNDRMTIKAKGYSGCGMLRRKGAKDIKAWLKRGIECFVICHDADSKSPEEVRKTVMKDVVTPSDASDACCVTIPVQEIEAWMIADELAIRAVIPTFVFQGHPNPESIPSPKEWLIKQSKARNGKPLYSPATFNPAVARHLRLDIVQQKCPSFKAFLDCLNRLGGE